MVWPYVFLRNVRGFFSIIVKQKRLLCQNSVTLFKRKCYEILQVCYKTSGEGIVSSFSIFLRHTCTYVHKENYLLCYLLSSAINMDLDFYINGIYHFVAMIF